MTLIRLINADETRPPDDPERTGAPVRQEDAVLPAIDAGPILMRRPRGRHAIPDFDGEDDTPFGNADLIRQVEDAADAAVKAWPGSMPAPRRRADEAAGSRHDRFGEGAAQRAEIAELQAIQQKQNAALRRARGDIIDLDDTVKLLRAKLTQQEKETAAAKQAAQQSDKEKAALRTELDQTMANFAELVQQSAGLNAALEQREKEIAAVRETVTSLKAELTAKAGETDLTAAIAEAKTRYYSDFNKRCAQFEVQAEKLARMIGARDERIRSLEDENLMLTARCDVLAGRAADLDAGKKDAEEKLASQSAMVTFLDATLQAERDSTGQKIAQLATDLQCERLARAADARESVAACEQIARLLPKLARPSGRVMESMERAGQASEPVMNSAANNSSVTKPITATS